MNKKAQRGILGISFLILALLFIITSFVTIEPLKEALDSARDNAELNCPGTDGFNQTDYDDDNALERQVRRPTCFITGITMVYFVGSFLISVVVWLVSKWSRLS